MKFNIYIGNPPYQQGNRSIYQEFIRQALNVQADNACLIVNNNWLEGDTHIATRQLLINSGLKTIINFNVREVFPEVHVAVSIIHYQPHKEKVGDFEFIQKGIKETIEVNEDITLNSKLSVTENNDTSIIDKIINKEYLNTWDKAKNARVWSIASNGYHMYSNYTEDIYKWYEESGINKLGEDISKYVKVAFLDPSKSLYFRYTLRDSLIRGQEYIDYYKVVCGSKAQTTKNVISNIHILKPGEICTNSFGIVGLTESKCEAEFIYKYANTKFFRYLVLKAISGIKVSFGTGCTKYVPLISEKDQRTLGNLTIEELNKYLYKKYELTENDIGVIEETVQ